MKLIVIISVLIFGFIQHDISAPTNQLFADVGCMASVIFAESSTQPKEGQQLVGLVVLNRSRMQGLEICQVIKIPNQFAIYIGDVPAKYLNLAHQIIKNQVRLRHKYGNITYFHSTKVEPEWTKQLILKYQIGDHKFYEPATSK